MVSTIESPNAAITYESLLGLGLTEGSGVGLGLGEGAFVGIGEITTAVLVSFKILGDGTAFSAVFGEKKNDQEKIPAVRTIKAIRIILIGRYFKINILGQDWHS